MAGLAAAALITIKVMAGMISRKNHEIKILNKENEIEDEQEIEVKKNTIEEAVKIQDAKEKAKKMTKKQKMDSL